MRHQSSSWLTPIDHYCERLGPALWGEPLNALSNAAFLIAAVYAYGLSRRTGCRDWAVLWLIGITAAVGIGSFLFHTFAQKWSLLADVVPIAVFIYSYFLLAMRRYLGLGWLTALLATGLFAFFNISFSEWWLGLFPGLTLNGSIGYLPAAMALLLVGMACLAREARRIAFALVGSAGLFALSLFFRSIDHAICATIPFGTHALWHLLNALPLGVLMTEAIIHSTRQRAGS